MVSHNEKRRVKYGQIQIRVEAIKEFKDRVRPGETQTQTILRLIKLDKENNNRKCPDCSDPGVSQTIAENA